ncbi:MAG: fibronectin type III domain-containing protein [Gemmatimonadetes bacterium]|nr:fibronectin type III domain-containing protein [Gemmatimonadota bacterium]
MCEGYPPEGVRAVALSDTSIEVSWNRIDRPEVGSVAGHYVYRDGVVVSPLVPVGHEEFPQTDSYIDTGLSADSTYSYRVVMQAMDGRRSATSPTVTAKTDTTPTRPAAPANLTATAQSRTISG